jgi:pyruvate dehydrogenase E2 component (dihydrolipoamide acetyltransferase)
MADVNMPKLSDTMEEGTVLEWKKQDGQEVRRGEVLAEIESDKASFEIESEADGVLHIAVQQGQPVPVGQLIGRIGGEAPEQATAPAGGTPPQQAAATEGPADAASAPAEAAPAAERPAPADEQEPPEGEPEPERAPEPARSAPSGNGADRIAASPLARRLAGELGVDLASVRGTGPEGRIVKEDVEAAAGRGGQRAPAGTAAAPRPRPAGPDVEAVEPNRMQATIARRMTESKTTVPHFYVTVEARVDEAVRVRQQLKELVPGADRVTMTDLLTRACAIALTRFPEVNASWVDGRFQRKRSVNIGLAVPPAKGLGLLVPVVHDVDRKDLVQISIESRQVIERARSGKPASGDLEGGTFSISNLGMFGVDEFSAIINPPESAILAVGQIKEVPVVEDGRVTVGTVMRMTLSVDHRVFYGSTAAQFMAEVRRLIENPVSLLVPPEQ